MTTKNIFPCIFYNLVAQPARQVLRKRKLSLEAKQMLVAWRMQEEGSPQRLELIKIGNQLNTIQNFHPYPSPSIDFDLSKDWEYL